MDSRPTRKSSGKFVVEVEQNGEPFAESAQRVRVIIIIIPEGRDGKSWGGI